MCWKTQKIESEWFSKNQKQRVVPSITMLWQVQKIKHPGFDNLDSTKCLTSGGKLPNFMIRYPMDRGNQCAVIG